MACETEGVVEMQHQLLAETSGMSASEIEALLKAPNGHYMNMCAWKATEQSIDTTGETERLDDIATRSESLYHGGFV